MPTAKKAKKKAGKRKATKRTPRLRKPAGVPGPAQQAEPYPATGAPIV